jgi:hypothetical protein
MSPKSIALVLVLFKNGFVVALPFVTPTAEHWSPGTVSSQSVALVRWM